MYQCINNLNTKIPVIQDTLSIIQTILKLRTTNYIPLYSYTLFKFTVVCEFKVENIVGIGIYTIVVTVCYVKFTTSVSYSCF